MRGAYRRPGRAHLWSAPVRLLGSSLVFFALVLGCPSRDSPPEPELDEAARLETLAWADHEALVGVSGAALRGRSELLLAPERTGQLLVVPVTSEGLGPPRAVPIEGAPTGADIEAIAVFDAEHVLLGTESQAERSTDPILLTRLGEEKAVVLRAIPFDYGRFGLRASRNQGIEGLCAVGGVVVAASEAVDTQDGRRLALVGTLRVDREAELVPHRVALRSSSGKLSALACRARRGAIEVHAIERHFGIARLVRFELPLDPWSSAPTGEALEAALVRDLAPLLSGSGDSEVASALGLGPTSGPPNIEGLTWIGAGALLAITDNHYGRRTGPTRAFRVHLTVGPEASLRR